MENKVKRALENCEPTFGSWLQIGAYPAIAEILAIAGFEWLAVDCEHSDIAVEGFTDLARGMQGVHRRFFSEFRVEFEREAVFSGRSDGFGHCGGLGSDPHRCGEREPVFAELVLAVLPT